MYCTVSEKGRGVAYAKVEGDTTAVDQLLYEGGLYGDDVRLEDRTLWVGTEFKFSYQEIAKLVNMLKFWLEQGHLNVPAIMDDGSGCDHVKGRTKCICGVMCFTGNHYGLECVVKKAGPCPKCRYEEWMKGVLANCWGEGYEAYHKELTHSACPYVSEVLEYPGDRWKLCARWWKGWHDARREAERREREKELESV